MPTLASLRLAYREIKQYFTIPTIVSARLTYSELQTIREDLGLSSDELIHYFESDNGRQIHADDSGFFEFLTDLERMPPQRLLVVFKTKVLMDSYLENINVLFYGVFSLVKSVLCLLHIAVVHLFRCGGERWSGYARGVGLVATLIRLFAH